MTMRKDLHEANRLAWNAATAAHNSHKRDQARFLREGGSTLFPEELALLGDVCGKLLVHLQCNSGQDTLSLAKLGAEATGVDISDEAVDFARQLSADSSIPATFVRADIFDWLTETAAGTERFDVVFSSYGALGWLSDLRAWAAGIAGVLRPGGRLVLVEFHPVLWIFEDDWSVKYPYSTAGEPLALPRPSDYVAASGEALTPSGYEQGVTGFTNPHCSYQFGWGLADVIAAVLNAGLRLEALREYPYANGAKPCERMRETPGRRMLPPPELPSLPLMYGLAARKEGGAD
jgi:SAM-dependent methyltransferase